MLTVQEAARRARRDPETIRRWIRSGQLRATKIGGHYIVEESNVELLAGPNEQLPLPKAWRRMRDGRPMPNVVRLIHLSRRGH